MTVPEFSVNRRITTLMFTFIIILFGVISFFTLGLDLMPEMDFPMVVIATSYPGVAAEDIENLITKNVEEVASAVSGVTSVYSASQEGISSVVVEFEWGSNLDSAAQDVRDRMAMIQNFLPSDAEDPMVIRFNPSEMPVIVYGVSGLENTIALKRYLEDYVAPRIERVEGAAAAIVVGGLEREVQVIIDQEKLAAEGVAAQEVLAALRMENLNVSAGHISKGRMEYMVRTLGEFRTLADINDTVITARSGKPVHVRDVALVKDTHAEVRNTSRLNGEPCVIMAVMKQSGANTVTIARNIRNTLKEMEKEFPGPITFAPVLDQSDLIEKALWQTLRSAFEGGLLAILLVYLFLWSWRPTLIIFLSIPLSVIATFIGLWAAGYTLNMFTIAGFALGVGLLVDNAVVVIENTFRHLEEGKGRKEAAIKGASEVGLAISASTFTTMAVFLPMVVVAGLASQLARPLALTVCMSLIASLVVAVTIVPMLTATLFKKKGIGEESARGLFNSSKRAYEKLLVFLVNRKLLVLGTAAILFAFSIVALSRKGMEMMPEMDSPMSVFTVKLPEGTRFEETDQLINHIEEFQRSLPETVIVISMVGPSSETNQQAARGFGAADVNAAMVFSRLLEKQERVRSAQDINDLIRNSIPDMEGINVSFQDMGFGHMGTGADSTPVAIRIFGNEIPVLQKYGQRVLDLIKDIDGIRDADVSLKVSKPELHIRVDREKAARYGLSAAQVGTLLETCVKGKLATFYRAQGEEVNIKVRLEEQDRNSVEKLLLLAVPTPVGAIRLGQVVSVEYTTGPLSIARESQHRKVTVTASIHNRVQSEVLDDIKKALAPLEQELVARGGGYFIDYGGTYKTMQETFTSLLYALIAALVLVYMIMAAQFESLAQPLIVMFTVPLAIIGVVIGLSVMGMSFSTPAFMGLVILMGIVVNNAIVMIDFINQLRAKGMGMRNAVIQGAVLRLRPILITSLTTIFGMLPMGLARTQGSEMSGPIGVAIASGLLFGMLLTLVVIPCSYIVGVQVATRVTGALSYALYGKE